MIGNLHLQREACHDLSGATGGPNQQTRGSGSAEQQNSGSGSAEQPTSGSGSAEQQSSRSGSVEQHTSGSRSEQQNSWLADPDQQFSRLTDPDQQTSGSGSEVFCCISKIGKEKCRQEIGKIRKVELKDRNVLIWKDITPI